MRKSETYRNEIKSYIVRTGMTMSYFSLLRVHCDENKCIHCGKCLRVCPMNVGANKESRKRKNGTECILCYECTQVCPTKALH